MRSKTPILLAVAVAASLGSGCVEQTDEKPSEEDLKVIKQNILAATPSPKHVANADLDGKVTYLGCDIDPEPIEPGKDTKVVHYWKVDKPPGEGWRAFTHVNGPNKQGFINFDHGPVRGKYPVARWKAGEVIRDEHTIKLPASWQYPKMELYVGIWKGPTRLTVRSGASDGDNRVLAASIPVSGRIVAPRKRYVVRKAVKPPKIDGKLDDEAWKNVPGTGLFVNTLNGAPAEQRTETRMLWDGKFLYVAFENQDNDVWSSLTKHDDKLWTQEADELMIDADGDGRTYIELQVAPNGTTFDTYLPEYRKYEDSINPKRKPYDWSSKMKVAVQVDGTLNKRDDQDKGWTVEMAIPLEDVKGLAEKGPKLPPSPGDVWRANMFRMDLPQGKAQQASGWSPPMVGDFHALDKFGELVFGDEKGNIPSPTPPAAAPSLVAPPAPLTVGASAPVAPGQPPQNPNQMTRVSMPPIVTPTGEIDEMNPTRGNQMAGARGGAAVGEANKK